jgi:hypothetical protein
VFSRSSSATGDGGLPITAFPGLRIARERARSRPTVRRRTSAFWRSWISRLLQIGKALVEKDPTFANPDRTHDWLKTIDEIHIRDHCVTVTLTEQEMAEAMMQVTHEKDLPRA